MDILHPINQNTDQMLRVGITGGMGSGKTTACKFFQELGIPVYYADARAKWLMTQDEALVASIKEMFGSEAYFENGQLNRPYIAGIVFKDPERLGQLNALVHPAVARDGERWHQAQQEVPFTLKEAALIFESGSYRQLDYVITVHAPLPLRIKRIMKRDGSTKEAVLDRISKQMQEEKKLHLADYLILNDHLASMRRQVRTIYNDLSVRAQ